MQISVKLFGALRQFLPPGSQFNSCQLTVGEDASINDVLLKLPIPDDKPFLVLFNDTKIDREQYADISVSASDAIVLLPPIKGG